MRILLSNPKYPHNVAGIIRAASNFGVVSVNWTGTRVEDALAELSRIPREERMKGYAKVEWGPMERPFDAYPECTPVCVELTPGSESLPFFEHPENPLYVFGPEDGSVKQVHKRFCQHFIHIPSQHCLNLSAAVNVVLYDRVAKMQVAGTLPYNVLQEDRGILSDVVGWDGK